MFDMLRFRYCNSANPHLGCAVPRRKGRVMRGITPIPNPDTCIHLGLMCGTAFNYTPSPCVPNWYGRRCYYILWRNANKLLDVALTSGKTAIGWQMTGFLPDQAVANRLERNAVAGRQPEPRFQACPSAIQLRLSGEQEALEAACRGCEFRACARCYFD